MLTRRRFFMALAASAAAAGCKLPIGLPRDELVEFTEADYVAEMHRWIVKLEVNWEAVVIDPDGVVEIEVA